jgi:hypothetical protein
MLFIAFVMLSAFLLEGLGTWISVLGLSALFAGSPIVIAMAVSLDIAKVASVTFLYKNWKEISLKMKFYMSFATLVLMIITSAGVFGFLSGEFQKAISGNNQQTVLIDALTEEKDRLQKRKEEIDAQIANLPANSVTSRVRLTNQFKVESTSINKRLVAIDKELPELKVNAISQNTKIGPIMYVASVFNTTPEQAVKWVILFIIFVFDPLAVALLVAGNFLIARRKSELEPAVQELPVFQAPVKPPVKKVEPTIVPWKYNIKVEPQVEKEPVEEPQKPSVVPPAENEPAEAKTEQPEIITMRSLKSQVFKSSLDDADQAAGQIVYPDAPIPRQQVLPFKTSMEEINVSNADIEFTNDTYSTVAKVYRRE